MTNVTKPWTWQFFLITNVVAFTYTAVGTFLFWLVAVVFLKHQIDLIMVVIASYVLIFIYACYFFINEYKEGEKNDKKM
jgi:hypothetical protein